MSTKDTVDFPKCVVRDWEELDPDDGTSTGSSICYDPNEPQPENTRLRILLKHGALDDEILWCPCYEVEKMTEESELPAAALELFSSRITMYMHRMNRSCIVGELGIDAGCSIERTYEILTLLEEAGTVRELCVEDKHKLHIDNRCSMYVLVGSSSLAKGHS